MREDFAAFILTHGRPDRVYTYRTLRSHGYTGRIILLVDDEDKTLPEYRDRYGDEVEVFSKPEIAATFDEGDNFQDRRAIIYARNATFEVAKRLGIGSFIQLDDDYSGFYYRFDGNGFYGNWKLDPLDWCFDRLVTYLESTPFVSVAISQGGDHIGGGSSKSVNGAKRKAMNSFVCLTDRPFQFVGRINEDVNTYTCEQRRGKAFLTVIAAQVNQKATQSNAGGMTELYLDSGTYVKTFYSVMYAPSCVKVSVMSDPRKEGGHRRIHHKVNWLAAAPLILREEHKKSRREGR